MPSIHATHAVALALEADQLAPLFLPLLALEAGTRLLPSQCTLTVAGVPSPLEVALMLCAPGTALGDPADAALQTGALHAITADEPYVLAGGNVPPLEGGGVLGLSVPVQMLSAGASVTGTLSTVREASHA